MRRQRLTANFIFNDRGFAESYARRHERYSRRMSGIIIRLLSESGFSGGRILDAGCGPGYEAMSLRRAFPSAEVIGIDLSEPLLNFARRSAENAGLRDGLRFETANVENIPYPDDSFDAVISLFLWNVLADPARMCNEIERVLKPGGRLIMIDLRRIWWLSLFEPATRRAYVIPEVFDLVKRTNLRPVQMQRAVIWWCLTA